MRSYVGSEHDSRHFPSHCRNGFDAGFAELVSNRVPTDIADKVVRSNRDTAWSVVLIPFGRNAGCELPQIKAADLLNAGGNSAQSLTRARDSSSSIEKVEQ